MALLQVDFFSEVLGMCTQMSVILPQRTRRQIGMTGAVREGKYPAVFLLHGMTDDHTTWCRRTSIERYVSELGIAVVMPEVHLGWYTDTKYGMRYQTYISRELPGICREFFPNISERKEDILAAGVSMGGYGAWKAALDGSENSVRRQRCRGLWILRQPGKDTGRRSRIRRCSGTESSEAGRL